MPNVKFTNDVRTLRITGSLISGLNQTGALAGAFADSSGEGSSNYAGGGIPLVMEVIQSLTISSDLWPHLLRSNRGCRLRFNYY